MIWKVVPFCNNQLKDINPKYIIDDFRLCDVYKGGGGYDKFPSICKKRLGIEANLQFVVQLYGCPLNCWYCYVTPEGIWGKYREYRTKELIAYFRSSESNVFHLMGGAPALYIESWGDIINNLSPSEIFHSDLLLIEKEYDENILKNISQPNCLYAISIKGLTKKEFEKNTGRKLNEKLFWVNFDKIVENKLPFYITYTGINVSSLEFNRFQSHIEDVYGKKILEDSFNIPIIKYKALGE